MLCENHFDDYEEPWHYKIGRMLPSINQDVLDFARVNKISPVDLVFHGGEEYEIVATINPKNLSRVKANAKRQKISLFEIGHVSKGSGLVYKTGSKTIRIKNKGWLHFRS